MARDIYIRLRQYLHATTGQPVHDQLDRIREQANRFKRPRRAHIKEKDLCR